MKCLEGGDSSASRAGDGGRGLSDDTRAGLGETAVEELLEAAA